MKVRHQDQHPGCPYRSKTACERARRGALGQCVSMISEDKQCKNLGVDAVEGRAFCGQHIMSVFLEADRRRRAQARADEMNARIDAYIAAAPYREQATIEWWNSHPEFHPVETDIVWLGESGVGVDVATGATVAERDGGIVDWGPENTDEVPLYDFG